MIDPGTGLTILGTAVGGAKVVEKILGPTAEYVGQQLKEWTEKKVKNTANIEHPPIVRTDFLLSQVYRGRMSFPYFRT